MTPKRRIIPVFVPHLGCPHDCVFCNQRRISGAQRPAEPADVHAAVMEASERTDTADAEIAFYGGSFTAIPQETQEALLTAAQEEICAGRAASIRLSTRPDCIDSKVIDRLHRFSVETVELGVQSMDEGVLRLSGRGHSARDAENAAKHLKSAGFQLILQMMTGLPGDTWDTSVATAEALAALHPDGVRIYPTVVVRDTALFDLWQSGQYRPQSVAEATELCAALLDIFDRAHIPVIRIGLNPTPELSGGGAAAGAYHPALGELARSRRYFIHAKAALAGVQPGEDAVLLVGRGKTSLMAGQHRDNLKRLQSTFALRSLQVRETELPENILVMKK